MIVHAAPFSARLATSAQRFTAALRAISDRRSGVSFFIRCRTIASACGFFRFMPLKLSLKLSSRKHIFRLTAEKNHANLLT